MKHPLIYFSLIVLYLCRINLTSQFFELDYLYFVVYLNYISTNFLNSSLTGQFFAYRDNYLWTALYLLTKSQVNYYLFINYMVVLIIFYISKHYIHYRVLKALCHYLYSHLASVCWKCHFTLTISQSNIIVFKMNYSWMIFLSLKFYLMSYLEDFSINFDEIAFISNTMVLIMNVLFTMCLKARYSKNYFLIIVSL